MEDILLALKIVGVIIFVFICGISHGNAHDGNIGKVLSEIESMKKEDTDKYRDFRYVLRHIRSFNKKQGNVTSVSVARAITEHAYGKRYRFTSREHRLNFLSVIVGIIEVESGFDPDAVSGKDARGLMQVHWPTWNRFFSSREEVHDLTRNLAVGTGILRLYMMRSNNDLRSALHKYLGAKDDRYADRVIASAAAFKKSVLSQRIKEDLKPRGSR